MAGVDYCQPSAVFILIPFFHAREKRVFFPLFFLFSFFLFIGPSKGDGNSRTTAISRFLPIPRFRIVIRVERVFEIFEELTFHEIRDAIVFPRSGEVKF